MHLEELEPDQILTVIDRTLRTMLAELRTVAALESHSRQ